MNAHSLILIIIFLHTAHLCASTAAPPNKLLLDASTMEEALNGESAAIGHFFFVQATPSRHCI